MIGETLNYCTMKPADLDAVVVSSGPGSYTGLRIGVSTAKGLAFAHDISLIAIPTLEALAYSALPFMNKGDYLAVVLNARKNEFYVALFRKEGGKEDHEPSYTLVMPPRALAHTDLGVVEWPALDEGSTFWTAGEGGETFSTVLAAALPPSTASAIHHLSFVRPSASSVAMLGAQRYEAGRVEELSRFEPCYLKDFVPRRSTKNIFDRLPF